MIWKGRYLKHSKYSGKKKKKNDQQQLSYVSLFDFWFYMMYLTKKVASKFPYICQFVSLRVMDIKYTNIYTSILVISFTETIAQLIHGKEIYARVLSKYSLLLC